MEVCQEADGSNFPGIVDSFTRPDMMTSMFMLALDTLWRSVVFIV